MKNQAYSRIANNSDYAQTKVLYCLDEVSLKRVNFRSYFCVHNAIAAQGAFLWCLRFTLCGCMCCTECLIDDREYPS